MDAEVGVHSGEESVWAGLYELLDESICRELGRAAVGEGSARHLRRFSVRPES